MPLRPVDQLILREIFAAWPSGVAVVTMRNSLHRPLGITARSFSFLSVEPPLVITCLASGAGRLAEPRRGTWFAVHILASNQESLARSFAACRSAATSADFAFARGTAGLPLVSGTLGLLECSLVDVWSGGDQFTLIGEVYQARLGAGGPLIHGRPTAPEGAR
jgi:flavin reductase (DIM6/NTAB) family NADH-FMN oxidoreductase RutF